MTFPISSPPRGPASPRAGHIPSPRRSLDIDIDGDDKPVVAYMEEGVLDTIKSRGGWLLVFFIGLMIAAVVVERFEHVLKEEVELSYFVPLLIGHGGNTGSQSVATVIRAIALDHVKVSDLVYVLQKEAAAGAMMGTVLGLLIFLVSFIWDGIQPRVGVTVAVALPVVSLWANFLGALFPLTAVWLG